MYFLLNYSFWFTLMFKTSFFLFHHFQNFSRSDRFPLPLRRVCLEQTFSKGSSFHLQVRTIYNFPRQKMKMIWCSAPHAVKNYRVPSHFPKLNHQLINTSGSHTNKERSRNTGTFAVFIWWNRRRQHLVFFTSKWTTFFQFHSFFPSTNCNICKM